MQAPILIVAPFRKLAEDIELVIAEQFPKQKKLFRVVEADLEDARKLLEKNTGDAIKVIVSRGGTARLLTSAADLPVVRIQVSVMDVMQAVLQVSERGSVHKIGISGFDNMVYGCEEIEKILDMHFIEFVIRGEEEAEAKIQEAIRQGVDVLVGDAVSVRVAKKYGLKAKVIESGKQAILQALQEAVLISRVVQQDEVKSRMLSSVINKSQDGIVAVDGENKIILFNPEAELIFHRVRYEVMGKPLAEFCSSLTGRQLHTAGEIMADVYGKQMLVKISPIQNGSSGFTIYTLQQVSEVQRLEQSIRKKLMAKGLTAKYRMEDVIGRSRACQNMKNKAARYALTDSTILITGESGTGKEMLVQGIHNMSQRASGPFVAVNCAALPENLLESELFGYVDGAFTGARKGGRQGVFEMAHGGTLFLDEIGEMPISLQSRLLRVLQEREVMPLGSESIIPVDVRVIAATNQNLADMVANGEFRQDLYYRLNILRIHMPTLAERREDIPLLARSMMKKMQKLNPQLTVLTDAAADFLQQLPWPGNIRQLANMIERIMLLTDGTEIDRADIQAACEDDVEIRPFHRSSQAVPAAQLTEAAEHEEENGHVLQSVEEETMYRVLQEEGYNYSRAAKRLGIHRTTLWRKMKKYQHKSTTRD